MFSYFIPKRRRKTFLFPSIRVRKVSFGLASNKNTQPMKYQILTINHQVAATSNITKRNDTIFNSAFKCRGILACL